MATETAWLIERDINYASAIVAQREASRQLTPEQEWFALGFNPWDERDATYRVLTNQFITTRRPHRCAICFEAIVVGQRVRSQSEVAEGHVKTFRFCTTCCDLMARRRDDEAFEQLMGRYGLGRSTSEAAGDRA